VFQLATDMVPSSYRRRGRRRGGARSSTDGSSGRVLVDALGRCPLGGWRTRFSEGVAGWRLDGRAKRARRGGVLWILRARHGRKSHTATENTASLSVKEPSSVLPLRPRRRSGHPGCGRRQRSQSVSAGEMPNLPAIDDRSHFVQAAAARLTAKLVVVGFNKSFASPFLQAADALLDSEF